MELAIAARQGAPDSESVVDTLHRLREERTLALGGEESQAMTQVCKEGEKV